jgi:membrane dipeptidase
VTAFGTWDFGLTEEQEERAARLHRESVIVDLLFQGPLGYRAYDEDLLAAVTGRQQGKAPADAYFEAVNAPVRRALEGRLPSFEQTWRESGITAGNRQAGPSTDGPLYGLAIAQFDRFPWLDKVLTAGDIRTAKREGRCAGIISSQDAEAVGRDLELLETAHLLGMRMLGLTYNMLNSVGAGCTERVDPGLSHHGVRLVQRMNDLGMVVDTAHSGARTTIDACEVSGSPVVASHTGAAAVFPADRCKSDEELQAIAATGGVVGICAVPFFLTDSADASVEHLLDHVDHVASLVGWQHVGIGTDWPLQADKDTLRVILLAMALELGFREEHRLDPVRNLAGFDDYRDFPNITRGLVARGYSDEQVAGILGENALRVFEKAIG